MSTLSVNNVTEVGGAPVVTGGVLDSGSLPTGAVIGYDSVTKTDTFTASLSSGASSAVTGLSLSYTPKSASSKLVITAFFGSASTTDGRGNIGIAVSDGTNFLSVGDADSNRTRVTAGGFVGGTPGVIIVSMPSVTIMHEPGSTDTKTYTVHIFNVDSTSETVWVNRREENTDDASVHRSASALHIMEVAG